MLYVCAVNTEKQSIISISVYFIGEQLCGYKKEKLLYQGFLVNRILFLLQVPRSIKMVILCLLLHIHGIKRLKGIDISTCFLLARSKNILSTCRLGGCFS